MAEETWRVILTEDLGAGGGPVAGGGAGSAEQKSAKAQEEMAEQEKRHAPAWANVGKLVGSLAGIAGIIAFVFQMIRRSKIFTTFMDSFLMILSAFVDIMMIPLMPIFSWVLKYLVGLLPMVMNFSKKFSDFMKDPWGGIKDLFAKFPEWIKGMGESVGKFFQGMGLGDLGKIFSDIGQKLGGAFSQVVPIFTAAVDKIRSIWSDKGLSFWEKIGQTAITVWNSVRDAAKPIWAAIKDIWNNDIFPFIKEKWNEFYETSLVPKWESFRKLLETTWNTFYNDNLKKKWDEFVVLVKENWKKYVIDPLMANWKYFVGEYLPKVWDWFLHSWLPTEWGKAVDKMRQAFLDAINPVKQIQKIIAEIRKPKEEETEGAGKFPKWEGPGWAEPIVGGGQFGIPRVSQTGLYMLHRGEKVTSASENRTTNNYNRPIVVNQTLNISEVSAGLFGSSKSGTKSALDEAIKASKMRGYV